MNDEITVETVEAAIQEVTHPEIDATLVELGMIDDVRVEDGQATIDVAIPIPNIPDAIKQLLAKRLAVAVDQTGADLTVRFVVMNEETRTRFFQMEEENWSGLENDEDSSPQSPF